MNLELFSAIGDAIVADAPIQIASPPNTRQESQQDIFVDIPNIPTSPVDPQDLELVSNKIQRVPNLELLWAIDDAILADPSIEIVEDENGSPPDANVEFHQDVLDDILTGVQIVVVEPEDQDHVPKKIKRKPRILQRPVS